jgi:hypothetical protein
MGKGNNKQNLSSLSDWTPHIWKMYKNLEFEKLMQAFWVNIERIYNTDEMIPKLALGFLVLMTVLEIGYVLSLIYKRLTHENFQKCFKKDKSTFNFIIYKTQALSPHRKSNVAENCVEAFKSANS